MLAYILKRLGVAVLVALTVSALTFSMIYLSGDPATALAGESATPQDIEHIRDRLWLRPADRGAVCRLALRAPCRAISAGRTIWASRSPA